MKPFDCPLVVRPNLRIRYVHLLYEFTWKSKRQGETVFIASFSVNSRAHTHTSKQWIHLSIHVCMCGLHLPTPTPGAWVDVSQTSSADGYKTGTHIQHNHTQSIRSQNNKQHEQIYCGEQLYIVLLSTSIYYQLLLHLSLLPSPIFGLSRLVDYQWLLTRKYLFNSLRFFVFDFSIWIRKITITNCGYCCVGQFNFQAEM